MPDYRIQQQVPTADTGAMTLQSNPFASLSQGIQSGAQLGFQAKQLQQQQQQLEIQKEQQKSKDFDLFGKAVESLNAMPLKSQKRYWENYVVPIAQKAGLGVTPDWNEKTDTLMMKDVGTIFKAVRDGKLSRDQAIDEIHTLGDEYQNEGDTSTAKYLEDMAKDMTVRKASNENSSLNRDLRKDQFNVSTAGKFQAAVTGNEGVRKVMAVNQQKLNNIGNAKALIDQVEQQPGGADRRQMFETAAATMKTLIGNNMLTEGEINQMIPSTYKGNFNKFLEKVSNQPQGLDAQKFVDRFKDTLSREYDVTNKQMESARGELFGGYKKWAEDNPEYSTPILQAQGIYHPSLNPSPIQHENPFKSGEDLSSMSDEELLRIAGGK